MSKINEVLLERGKITQAQFDKAKAKDLVKETAKSKDLTKLSNAELIIIIEKLIE